jgi:hypothetical protein
MSLTSPRAIINLLAVCLFSFNRLIKGSLMELAVILFVSLFGLAFLGMAYGQ